jgi:hypothetical protein
LLRRNPHPDVRGLRAVRALLGEASEVVQEMYATDQDRGLALRPEGTAGVYRAYSSTVWPARPHSPLWQWTDVPLTPAKAVSPVLVRSAPRSSHPAGADAEIIAFRGPFEAGASKTWW